MGSVPGLTLRLVNRETHQAADLPPPRPHLTATAVHLMRQQAQASLNQMLVDSEDAFFSKLIDGLDESENFKEKQDWRHPSIKERP